jgi:hypothetical protein
VREEDDRLVIGGGIPPVWLAGDQPLAFGPTPTPYGPVRVAIEPQGESVVVRWEASWRGGRPPAIVVALPERPEVVPAGGQSQVVVNGVKEGVRGQYAYRHADQSV